MSVRSVLRKEALQRDGGCVWPDCDHEGRLEMAHIVPSGSGGRDELDAVAMLCRTAHNVLDARVSWKQAQPRVYDLYCAYLQTTPFAMEFSCVWPACDDVRGELCLRHLAVLHDSGTVPGRTTEIRRLFAAYLGRDLYPPGQNDITKRKDG